VRIPSLLAAALLLAAGIASAAVQATDDAGARIVLAQPARRVVSLAPHLTEQLFAIGAGSRIVATTEFAD
jgi:iron complex transport system substrate-binding protein